MHIIGALDVFALLLCLLIHLSYRYQRRPLLPLPPGPTRWPIVGNAFIIPLTYVHVFYKQLGKKIGSKIMYLEALGRSIIVINDITMARELLEKRSALYSSRPSIQMLEMCALSPKLTRNILTGMISVGFKSLLGSMPYGDEWRIHRRIFEQHLSEKHLPRLQEKLLEFIRKGLVANLITNPDKLHDHVRNTIGGFSISITYGLPVKRQHDPLVHFAEEGFTNLTGTGAPGKYLVNIFPLLKYVPEWMPGSGFKQEAKKIRKQLDRLMEEPYQVTVQMIKEGTAPPSFVVDALDQYPGNTDYDLYDQYVKQTANQIFAAVSETTVASVMTFILAMMMHPDVQLKAQKEVDSIVGADRLPEMMDVSSLTFLSAILKEVFRWNPVLPFGVPHLATKEDVYMGYYIPKDCIILANTYAMLHDEEVFVEPEAFKPERFIDESGTLRKDLPDPEFVASFGFGRRICPGAHIARPALSIIAASLLYLFDFSPALDPEGKSIIVKPEFTAASIVSEPLPFPYKVTPREGRDVKNLLRDFFGTEPI